MDPFLNLPDELIVKMCNELGTESLLNLSESSSRVYQVCSKIIEKRKNTFLEYQKKIDEVKNYIKSRVTSKFESTFYDPIVITEIYYYSNPYIGIKQYVKQLGGKGLQDIPQILPNLNYFLLTPYGRSVNVDKTDAVLEQIAKNLVDQGYEIIE